jgi:20S proteasome subunit alpha 4
LAGFSSDKPVLFQTDPAGTHSSWKAQVIGGRNAKSLREFLEKGYEEGMSEAASVKLAVQALLEVVDSGAKNMEVCVVRKEGSIFLEERVLDEVVKQIEEETGEKKGSIPASAP